MKTAGTSLLICICFIFSGCLTTKIHGRTTSELQLRHSQLQRLMTTARAGDQLVEEYSDFEKELAAVELELLHRYEAGDKKAYLPQFGN